jgi:phenylpyruvate tautomerase PptA (4-oxalocrotonate tautomerase family)
MPYLRFFCPELPVETRRALARELTAGVVRALHLPPDAREETTVYFLPFHPEDVAVGGVLVADGADPTYHLEVIDRTISPDRRVALNRELTPLLAHLLGLGAEELDRINLIFHSYDAHDLSVGGRFHDEMGH